MRVWQHKIATQRCGMVRAPLGDAGRERDGRGG
jgi:hypothetical protein